MTQEAWIFMGTVWAIIIGGTVYCFARLLTSHRALDGEEEELPPEEGGRMETGIREGPG
jgi:hypothetical protein